ncbi:hypothetical protein Tsubulata_050789 [Turnera subulata]|uniref:Uncharacterized protein n=1 Tax=Turnera subulata TaxID=218843 RepID=A0A9Q0F8D5_9ROSI|nr:hypothetical protein Tsubulata_050789 [Turnera subulata]
MRRFLLRNVALCTRNRHQSNPNVTPNPSFIVPLASSSGTRLRFYSSESDSSNQNPDQSPESALLDQLKKKKDGEIQDVSNKDLKEKINKYFKESNEEVLPQIMEAILNRKLLDKHGETDDEWTEELRMKPLDDVKDKEFESDFEELYDTEEEIDDLYNAEEYVYNKMVKDEYFNMDNRKWDEMVKEAMQHGFITDTKECEEILEDMLHWDKLLPVIRFSW